MRISALVRRIVRQFLHDKRSLALMFLAPLLIMLLMSLVFNGSDYHPNVALVSGPPGLQTKLADYGANVRTMDAAQAERELENADVDAVLTFRQGGVPDLKLEGSDPSRNRAVLLLLQKLLQDMTPATQVVKSHIAYLHGSEDMPLFDNFGPVLIGFFSFFFVFLLSGVAFLRERTGGTLERLLATPLRRSEIVVGYLIGFGLFALVQSALLTWFSVDVLGMMMEGAFGYLLLVTLLMAMSALTLGTLLSAFANNEFQMMQFIPIIVVPQIFFSGLFNMETMAQWLRWLGVVMPLTYGADAMRNVMIRGKGWDAIAADVWALLAFSVVFAALNVLALKKHRKI